MFLMAICGSVILIVSLGMCARCRGGTGTANFTNTPASGSSSAKKTTGKENSTVVQVE